MHRSAASGVGTGVEVALGTELTALEQDATGVRLSLRCEDGGTRNVSARYVVACDGASSTVRRLLQPLQDRPGRGLVRARRRRDSYLRP